MPKVRRYVPRNPFVEIFRGLLNSTHIKQFVAIMISFGILFALFHFISWKTFFLLIIFDIALTLLFTCIEKLCKEKKESKADTIQDALISITAQFEKVPLSYEIKPYSNEYIPCKKCHLCETTLYSGEQVAFLPCSHAFHPKCLDKYLKVSNSCPICHDSYI